MKHQIKHRHTGAVLFEADIPDDTPSGLIVRVALEKAVEARASLGRANLVGANLYGANLDGASLYGANLDGASLYGASLARANLYGANLDGASLARANLDGAILYGANLVGASLARANLVGANLYGANLDGASLYGANLDGAILYGANLVGERPVLQIGPIGSRCAYFVAYLTNKGVILKAGCFTGTVDEFEAKLEEKHRNNEHAQEYRAALQMVKVHADIWGAIAEAKA